MSLSSDLCALALCLLEAAATPAERLAYCKEWNFFWPGYVRTLKRASDKDGEEEILWDELPTLIVRGDAKLLSLLGMLRTEEECATVLAVKVMEPPHPTTKKKKKKRLTSIVFHVIRPRLGSSLTG